MMCTPSRSTVISAGGGERRGGGGNGRASKVRRESVSDLAKVSNVYIHSRSYGERKYRHSDPGRGQKRDAGGWEGTVADGVTTDGGVGLGAHVVAECVNHLLDLRSELTSGGKQERLDLTLAHVNLVEDTDGEGGRLTSTRLSLRDDIATPSTRGLATIDESELREERACHIQTRFHKREHKERRRDATRFKPRGRGNEGGRGRVKGDERSR